MSDLNILLMECMLICSLCAQLKDLNMLYGYLVPLFVLHSSGIHHGVADLEAGHNQA